MRMYRLFARLPDGLPPMADILRQHIAAIGNDKIDQRLARLDSAKDGEKETNQVLNMHTEFHLSCIIQFIII